MYIETTNSTNTLMRQRIAEGNPPKYIYAGYQTAGRGQTGNGWESEKGKNLLCSVLVEQLKIKDKSPFYLNAAVSVAVWLVVKECLNASGAGSLDDAVAIKWPNDIYWGDKKLAGILIENAIIGNELKYSIAGIGLNVNQTVWQSDAPNPISLRQITDRTYDLDTMMQSLMAKIEEVLQTDVWHDYCGHLYRREGFWPFVEREVNLTPTMNATAEAKGQFMARIVNVLPTGEIVLENQQGEQRKYHFKQIRYIV